MYLIVTATDNITFNKLDYFFSAKSIFFIEKIIENHFYFKVDSQEDADSTELAMNEEINRMINDSEELNYSFEIED